MNYARFQKPSRYINRELNAIYRNLPPSRESIRIALCFPDVYEIGMSHLGLKILYEIINSIPLCSAERVFAPWPDYEAYLKELRLPLNSLESRSPIAGFDVVGFSLQYELSYTTVLNMLSLGGIPLHSEERMTGNAFYPLVIAGGPSAFNPLPMAPFIDAFLLGDGEEAVCELLALMKTWKRDSDGNKESLLKGIAGIGGFFVPLIHSNATRISRRIISDLSAAPYPTSPVIPYAGIVHDRVTIEVSRGCPMGCRFCQAGMIYRPYRQRDPEQVLKIAEESIRRTGYEEVSFSSLSAGDYPCLLPLINEFNRRFSASRVAVSLPSLRVGAIDRDVLRAIRSVRKTGFTIAPEAGSDRLRSVINKDFTGEDFERAVATLFEEGWQHLKLYFMIGLPTESDEDLSAIRDMAHKALAIAKKKGSAGAHITVSVSPFVPKAHTPFQWCGQISIDEMRRRQGILRKLLSRKNITFKGHDPEVSGLEALFARADRRHAALIERAWALGCRLDGWSDHFNYKGWLRAMEETGINGIADAGRSLSVEEALPWEAFDIGVSRDFFLREHRKSVLGDRTPSCTTGCGACGLGCQTPTEKDVPPRLCAWTNGEPAQPPAAEPATDHRAAYIRMRARYSKTGDLRHLSHLELSNVLLRALRRERVALDYTKGFHPLPRVSFGPPLSVGIAGEREYFDMHVFPPFDAEDFIAKMNASLPEGIRISAAVPVAQDAPSLTSFIMRYDYRFTAKKPDASAPDGLIYRHRELFPVRDGLTTQGTALPPLVVRRDDKEVDVGPCIENLLVTADSPGEDTVSVRMTLRDSTHLKARVGEIISALFPGHSGDITITRSAVYGWRDAWSEPL